MDDVQKTELEDLEQLIHSSGWKVFTDVVAKLWGTAEGGGARFLDAVTNASKAGDSDAIAHLRQIIAAQREIHFAVNWPETRIKQLKQAQTGPLSFTGSRRGTL
jgi:hypothetical protein